LSIFKFFICIFAFIISISVVVKLGRFSSKGCSEIF
jgi:hypothetical protein